jgi:hypothetical protein
MRTWRSDVARYFSAIDSIAAIAPEVVERRRIKQVRHLPDALHDVEHLRPESIAAPERGSPSDAAPALEQRQVELDRHQRLTRARHELARDPP